MARPKNATLVTYRPSIIMAAEAIDGDDEVEGFPVGLLLLVVAEVDSCGIIFPPVRVSTRMRNGMMERTL